MVGAGPVGMTAAALLAARGVKVALVERNAATSEEPKAISIDDEALRIYQSAGVAERLVRIVVPGTGTRYYSASGEPVFHARSATPFHLGHPFKNPFAQPDLERELHAHLAAQPDVAIRMATTLTGITQHDDEVELRCEANADGPVRLRARYVLGCDGGRSTVRELLGIGMTGRSYEDVWLVADVLEDPHDERYGMHHGDPRRPHVIVPGLGGRCRYEFLLHPGECLAGVRPPFELVRALLAPYRPLNPEQVERAVTYRFNAVVANRWRDGRVFLLGDAAHMMPPFAGQGLNSGIRDAANLCWKIADRLEGRLAESALDTYEAERRPHAEATVRLSTRLGRIVMTTDPRFARRRDRLVKQALRTDVGREFFEHMRYRPEHRYATGLLLPDSRYPVGVPIAQPRAFDNAQRKVRMLDEIIGSGWTLAGVGVDATHFEHAWSLTEWLDPVRVDVTVSERMASNTTGPPTLIDVDGGLDATFAPYQGTFVLLRPDRFVAAAWRPGETPDLAGPLRRAHSAEPAALAG